MTADALTVAVLLGSAAAFGAAAALALGWAFQTRQFDQFDRAARSIFDADEPVGLVTDTALKRAHDPD